MSIRRPLRSDEMDLNIHYFPRALAQRAKARAASVGLTLKQWLIGLITHALKSPGVASSTPGPQPPLAGSDTLIPDGRTTRNLESPPQPRGRTDLPPREES